MMTAELSDELVGAGHPAPGNAPPIHTHGATDTGAIALERGARSPTVSTKALASSTVAKNDSFPRHSSFVVMEFAGTRLTLVGEVARAYFTLAADRSLLAVSSQTVASASRTVALTQAA